MLLIQKLLLIITLLLNTTSGSDAVDQIQHLFGFKKLLLIITLLLITTSVPDRDSRIRNPKLRIRIRPQRPGHFFVHGKKYVVKKVAHH
jgi:hypothetical protein